jgi:hypothetical protein
MHDDAAAPFPSENPGDAGEGPLVPLPRGSQDITDPILLATWHEALSSALSLSIPHDLFAFWLYPVEGGSVLLGPTELAADRLAVPEPPAVGAGQLALLEEVIRGAGYASTTTALVRADGIEVGLLLFAALTPDVHAHAERIAALRAADILGPTLARLARRWHRDGSVRAERDAAAESAAVDGAAEAAALAGSPRDLARALTTALGPVLPHERLEILVPGSSPEQWYRIGEHPGGPLWGDPDLVVSRDQSDVSGLFSEGDSVLLAGQPGDPLALPPLPGQRAERSVVGRRLSVAGRTIGVIMFAHAEPGRYDDEDLALLGRVAPLVATRIDAFVTAGHLQVLRTHVATLRGIPSRIGRVLEALATTEDAAEATRRFESEAAVMVNFDQMWFALRLGDETRVAMVAPGEKRPLPDLPQMPLGATLLGRVVRGDSPTALVDAPDQTDLITALRVGGKVIGAMVLTARREGMFGGLDEEIARQLADAIAPHLELMRRAAVAPPIVPGWKRSPKL